MDPGLAVTGWGVINIAGAASQYVDSGVIRTVAATPHLDRLRRIADGLRQVVEKTSPDVICVERVFVNVNPKVSLLLGEARGTALCALMNGKAALIELSALQIKQSVTGGGRAGKKQVALMAQHLLGVSLANLPHDSTDALACALAAARVRLGSGGAELLGGRQRRTRPRRRAARR